MQMLKNLRAERGLSYDALAAQSGLSKAGVWQIENSKRKPNLRSLEKLAGALGVPVHVLIESEEVVREAVTSG